MKRAFLIAALLWPVAVGTAWPLDQIYKSDSEKVVRGDIQSMSPTVININSGAGAIEVPVNEVKRIIFDSSPGSLQDAQRDILHGDYNKALEALKNVATENKRQEVAQEIDFSRAYCTAQLTLSGEADLVEARNQLATYLRNSPNSFHFYKGCELLGDLYVAEGNLDLAQKCYAKLNQAPWPDYQIRAQVATGRAYLAQNNAAAADKRFDEALANAAPGDLAEVQRVAARIGKARCMVLNGNVDGAIRSLSEIIDKLDDSNSETSAMAYNAQGTALRAAGKLDKAVLAFLRVHLMYDLLADADAEAVANLEKLFIATHRPDHARDMRGILDERYKNSRWAKGAVK